jgi:tRNA uridine 5-carboxymethylaminomethyl modification enzyme
MFTSRAEFRLQLREDNADMRLTEAGRAMGLVDDARWAAFNRKRDAVARETERMKSTWVQPSTFPAAEATRLLGAPIEHEYSLAELLKRPDVDFDRITEIAQVARPDELVSRETLRSEFGVALADSVIEQAQIAIKYAGYIDKQNRDVERAASFEALRLPDDLDYAQVAALSFEARQKLSKHRPETLGQASRLSGITPAAVSLLLVHLKKGRFKGFATLPSDAETAVTAR